MRDRILEDMSLAQNLKKGGYRIWLTYTRDLTRTRMYDGFRELWTGLGRLSFPILRYSIALLLVAWLAALIGPLVPWLALLAGLGLVMAGAAHGAQAFAAGVILCLMGRYAIQPIFSVVKVKPNNAWLLPLAATLYCAAATYAAFRHVSGKGLAWKQRVYRRTE